MAVTSTPCCRATGSMKTWPSGGTACSCRASFTRRMTANSSKVGAFHDLLTQGVSIVVDEVDRSIPQISQLAAAVEREMGLYTNVNAYLAASS